VSGKFATSGSFMLHVADTVAIVVFMQRWICGLYGVRCGIDESSDQTHPGTSWL
jgi:hypothetical protein